MESDPFEEVLPALCDGEDPKDATLSEEVEGSEPVVSDEYEVEDVRKHAQVAGFLFDQQDTADIHCLGKKGKCLGKNNTSIHLWLSQNIKHSLTNKESHPLTSTL